MLIIHGLVSFRTQGGYILFQEALLDWEETLLCGPTPSNIHRPLTLLHLVGGGGGKEQAHLSASENSKLSEGRS